MVRANQLLRRVIQLSPMDLSVRSMLIEQLISQGATDDAIREYLDLADIYYRQGDFGLARQTFMNALRLAQKTTADHTWSVQILKRMADIDMQRLDWRQAVRVMEQIRTMQPDDEKGRISLIDLNFRLGQDAAALNELDSYRNYLESNGQRAHAVQFLKNILNEHPTKIELHKRLADFYHQAKRMPEAITELDIIGDMLFSSGNLAGAAAIIQAIIKLNPPNVAEYQQRLKQILVK
jgi:tetratricopeptide (TPR) repeat protein